MNAASKAAKPAEPAPKPRYNPLQNSAYMIALAWRKQKNVLFLCLATSALAVATSLVGLYIAPTILRAIETRAPLPSLLATILSFTAALIAVHAAASYINRNAFFGRVAVRLDIAAQMHRKLMTTSFPNTDSDVVRKKLETARPAVSSNQAPTEAIWNTLTDLLTNAAGFAIYLTLVVAVDPVLIAIVVATTVAGFLVTNRLSGWKYRHLAEEEDLIARLSIIKETAGNHAFGKDVRLFHMCDWFEDLYRSTMRLYEAFIARGERVYLWGDILDVALTFLRNGIAYAYLIGKVLGGGLSAPDFLLYFAAIGGFTAWMTGILGGLSKLHRQSLTLSIVREFLEYPEPFRFEGGWPLEPDLDKPYRIELRHVSYRYPGADADALHDIDLAIEPGEKIAIVGLNGAGKTTLVKLICGFYDPTEGEVTLNGVDIRAYDRRDVYRCFTAVFQDFSPISATIASNIAQRVDGYDIARVRACAERAGIAERIERLPQGYDTHLDIGKYVYEDGIELSGGEMQRLMLARALYKNAPIVVLDEPTAKLDPIAESDLYRRYSDLTGPRTSVYISHRLASTRFCDRVLLIDGNAIAEQGTHEQLLAQGGKYAELFEIQSRYYRKGGDGDDEAREAV